MRFSGPRQVEFGGVEAQVHGRIQVHGDGGALLGCHKSLGMPVPYVERTKRKSGPFFLLTGDPALFINPSTSPTKPSTERRAR